MIPYILVLKEDWQGTKMSTVGIFIPHVLQVLPVITVAGSRLTRLFVYYPAPSTATYIQVRLI
jgi:hypothetical protein